MTLKKIFPIALLALTLGQAPGLVGAEDAKLPAHYPDGFDIVGTLNGINSAEKYIVIDDRAIPLDLSARIYTPSSQFQTLSYLKPGMVIATNRTNSREVVKEIWVMPKDR